MSEQSTVPPSTDERLFDAARSGDVATLSRLLDQNPEKLTIRDQPYEMTLLHVAAPHLDAVNLLLDRGIDPNVHDRGDNTTAMHWAAAAGNLDVVRRLADAGVDVVGAGDDHALEVIGWASCWDGCDDAAHREVANFLVERGAKHHIFSAIALGLEDEVRQIVARDPSSLNRRMSRNENNQLPLHFAVRINRPAMVALLIELGADPLGVDASGVTFVAYAERNDVDRLAMERIASLTRAELDSATRGHRRASVTPVDLIAALTLGDWETAEHVARENPSMVTSPDSGALHILAKRGDLEGVRWLLTHGADASGRWNHFDAMVTPLHMAILGDHEPVVRALLDAGADASIRDNKHDGDARDWAEFFQRASIVELLTASS